MTPLLQDLHRMVDLYGPKAIAVIGPNGRVVDGFDSTGDTPEQRREQARVIAEEHNRKAKNRKPLIEKRYRKSYTVRLATDEIDRLQRGETLTREDDGEEVA